MRARGAWLERPEVPAQVSAFRVAFFGIVALDAVTTIAHAGGYGAGGFNVSHVSWLDAWVPLPDRRAVVASLFIQAWLALRIAAGVARGVWEGCLLAVLFAVTYLWSQLDSWQHRWLVLQVLVLLAGVRWQQPEQAWQLKVLRVQVSWLYVCTTLPKLETVWLDGTLPRLYLREGLPWVVSAWTSLGLAEDALWRSAGVGTACVELGLAVGLWFERSRPVAVVVGLAFHGLVEAAGLEIGWFSWYMAALYLLFVPAGWVERASARGVGLDRICLPPAAVVGAGLLVAVAVASRPVQGAGWAGACIALGTLLLDARAPVDRGPWRVCALVALSAWVGASASVWVDHYRYLGGDARRRGEVALSLDAYRRAAAADPSDATSWWKVAVAAEQAGRPQEALAAWRATLRADSDHPGFWWSVAQRLEAAGDGRAAREAARRVLERSPAHPGAAELLRGTE